MRQAEIDHRLANSIQFAAATLRHESRQIGNSEARTALTNAAGRLNAIARLHRLLTQDVMRDAIKLTTCLEPFCDEVSQSIGVEMIVSSAEEVELCGDVAGQICIILNELAINAVKHGAKDGRPVVLKVSANCSVDDSLVVAVRDNGPGLPEDFTFEASNGLGMMIITSAVEKLGGTIHILPGQGAGFEISLPFEAWNGTRAAPSPVAR
ncbi:MAG: sensor histidine kinase [Sulfitobacter sp.]|nr:sensor histidine kinase [Sulfitobacter sp.]